MAFHKIVPGAPAGVERGKPTQLKSFTLPDPRNGAATRAPCLSPATLRIQHACRRQLKRPQALGRALALSKPGG